MKTFATTLLLLTAISSPALAASTGNVYGAVDYGQWSMSSGGFANPGALTFSGGMRINPSMAAEVGYTMAGDSTITDPFGSVTYKQSALKFAAVGLLPVSPQVSLSGKLGISMITGTISGTGAYTFAQGSATTNSLMYGFGAQFQITPQVGARLSYEALGKTKADAAATGADVTMFSVGVAFNF